MEVIVIKVQLYRAEESSVFVLGADYDVAGNRISTVYLDNNPIPESMFVRIGPREISFKTIITDAVKVEADVDKVE